MRRLSIEVTPKQHQQLKAIAALQGKTLKDYVLEKVLPESNDDWTEDEKAALKELEAFLRPRIEAAMRGDVVNKSVTEIIDELKRERRARPV